MPAAGKWIIFLLVLLAGGLATYAVLPLLLRDRSELETALEPYLEGRAASVENEGEGETRALAESALVKRAVNPVVAGVLRKSAIDWDYFPQDMAPAYDLWLAYLASRHGRGAYYCPDRLSLYRMHDTSLTAGRRQDAERVFCYSTFIADERLRPIQGALRRASARSCAPDGCGNRTTRTLSVSSVDQEAPPMDRSFLPRPDSARRVSEAREIHAQAAIEPREQVRLSDMTRPGLIVASYANDRGAEPGTVWIALDSAEVHHTRGYVSAGERDRVRRWAEHALRAQSPSFSLSSRTRCSLSPQERPKIPHPTAYSRSPSNRNSVLPEVSLMSAVPAGTWASGRRAVRHASASGAPSRIRPPTPR